MEAFIKLELSNKLSPVIHGWRIEHAKLASGEFPEHRA
jgi:hypothetical protein